MKKTVDQFLDLDVQIKALTKKRNDLRVKLLDSREVGSFIPGSDGIGVLVTEATRSTIDSKAFKAELPDLAAPLRLQLSSPFASATRQPQRWQHEPWSDAHP